MTFFALIQSDVVLRGGAQISELFTMSLRKLAKIQHERTIHKSTSLEKAVLTANDVGVRLSSASEITVASYKGCSTGLSSKSPC